MKVQNARRVKFTQLRLKLAQVPSPSGGGGGGGDGRVSSERANRSQRLRSLLFFSDARGGILEPESSYLSRLFHRPEHEVGHEQCLLRLPIAEHDIPHFFFSHANQGRRRDLSFFRRRRRNSRVADREEDKYVCPHSKRRRRLKRIAPPVLLRRDWL